MTVSPYRIHSSVESMQQEAARLVAEALRPSSNGRNVTIALSGGSTPIGLHQRLADEPGIDWTRVHVFWGDERTVPPEHDDSNYRIARESLLERVGIPSENVHRMRGEIDPETAAREYESTLRSAFDVASGVPEFDVVVLGMGADGHTASLFPGTAALDEHERLVVANHAPQLETTRLTLTYPVLNAASQLLFLVAGADKADAAFRSVTGTGDIPPAGRIRPRNGSLLWLLDSQAGTLLQEHSS